MSRTDFDRLFDRLDSLSVGFGPMFRDFQYECGGYPPHNIFKSSDSGFTIELAVAGFKKSEIEVKELNGEVTIQGIKPHNDDKFPTYQYRGIATRDFVKKFKIAEYYEISEAIMEDGLLTIYFIKNEPEATKPKVFVIK